MNYGSVMILQGVSSYYFFGPELGGAFMGIIVLISNVCIGEASLIFDLLFIPIFGQEGSYYFIAVCLIAMVFVTKMVSTQQ